MVIFDELKNNDRERTFITFNDFKNAIIQFRLQLMRGLTVNSPDFNDYVKELFMMICSK